MQSPSVNALQSHVLDRHSERIRVWKSINCYMYVWDILSRGSLSARRPQYTHRCPPRTPPARSPGHRHSGRRSASALGPVGGESRYSTHNEHDIIGPRGVPDLTIVLQGYMEKDRRQLQVLCRDSMSRVDSNHGSKAKTSTGEDYLGKAYKQAHFMHAIHICGLPYTLKV